MYKYKSINDADEYGNTQLIRPSKHGDLAEVIKLLAAGCNPNTANTGLKDKDGKRRKGKGGITPLFLAKKYGHNEIIKALADGGAK